MLNPLSSILIEGRRWFDKVNGNTYHSVRIWVNGEVFGQLGLTYGYGDQYIVTATNYLVDCGVLHEDTRNWPLGRIRREFGIVIYTTVADGPKRDLFAPTVINPQLANN